VNFEQFSIMKNKGFYPLIVAVFLVFPLLLLGQQPAKVRFMPHWLHQAQFAGYYMASEKGFYSDHGLEVEILDGGPAYPVKKVFVEELAEFCTMFLSRAIELNDEGIPIVNICQTSQKSALVFVAKKTSGIRNIEDFNGKRIGFWRSDFQELPRAFLSKYDIECDIVPITSTINLFLSGGVDVMGVMWFNEYYQLYDAGIDFDELNSFFFYEYGLNFPEDGIYTSASFWDKKPDVCRKFAEATLQGWRYAFAHKEEAIEVVLRYQRTRNIPANKAHQRWMLNIMEKVIVPDNPDHFGHLDKTDFKNTEDVLIKSNSINKPLIYEDFNKR
jgi:NitT/TauT family transport system substrate-binding protein